MYVLSIQEAVCYMSAGRAADKRQLLEHLNVKERQCPSGRVAY